MFNVIFSICHYCSVLEYVIIKHERRTSFCSRDESHQFVPYSIDKMAMLYALPANVLAMYITISIFMAAF